MGVCPITELELLYSARSKAERDERIELVQATKVTGQPVAWVAPPGSTS